MFFQDPLFQGYQICEILSLFLNNYSSTTSSVIKNEFTVFLCLGNEASKDRYVGWSVGRFRHKFQKSSKNDLCAIKQILFDMGPLTLVRWPLCLYSSSRFKRRPRNEDDLKIKLRYFSLF